MGKTWRGWIQVVVSVAVAAAVDAAAAQGEGAKLYRRECLPCHGAEARGDGPEAALYDPPPRNLRDGTLKRYGTAELVKRIRTGRPLGLLLDTPQLRQRSADVETVVGYLRKLPTIDWPQVERGEELWVDRCELCHGESGKPPRRLPAGVHAPADLSDGTRLRTYDDAALAELVRHGRKGMPALLPPPSPDDVTALAHYARLFSTGHTLYYRYCAACHGEDGRPGDDVVDGIRHPDVVFDQEYFRTHDEEQLRLRAWHMVSEQKPSMPHFAHALDDAQVRAIVGYLRGLR